jgi:ATP/ADP translocase
MEVLSVVKKVASKELLTAGTKDSYKVVGLDKLMESLLVVMMVYNLVIELVECLVARTVEELACQ